jgi:hypothetical protein
VNAQIDSLVQKRAAVLQEMQSIDCLRRGSLSKQFFAAAKGQAKAKRGPYYVLQGFFRGKKFSHRVPADQAPQIEQQVQNYQRFQSLAEDYVTLTDQITQLQSPLNHSKKNSRLRKSNTSDSRKPKPS